MNGLERIAEAFASASAEGRRAALMPYLMGGFPDLATSREIGLAYASAGADLIELGVPFSDPAGRRPGDPCRCGDRAVRRGARRRCPARGRAAGRRARPGDRHVLRESDLCPWGRPVRRRARASGDQRPDRPRPPGRGGGSGARGVRPARPRPGAAGRPHHPGRPAGADWGERPGLRLRGLADRDHRRAVRRRRRLCRTCSARAARYADGAGRSRVRDRQRRSRRRPPRTPEPTA